jgi:hypothetical protein
MTVTTATGTTFAVGGTRIAATDTSAEYAALTWVSLTQTTPTPFTTSTGW